MEDSLIFHITKVCSLISAEIQGHVEESVNRALAGKINTSNDDTFLTIQEVADLLKISKSSVNKLRSQGLPSIKIFDSVRFSKKAVLEFIYNQNIDDS